MQEPSLILAISLAAAVIAAAFVAVRIYKSQRHYRNRTIAPTEINADNTARVFTSPSAQPDSSNVAVESTSSPESSIPPGQFGNEEPSVSPTTIAPPPDINVQTLIEEEIESEEKITETSNGNLERKAQGNITEITVVSPSETSSDVLMGRDKVEAEKAPAKDEDRQEKGLALSHEPLKPIFTIDRIDSQKEPTKEKGDFRGAPLGQRDKIPRESSRTEEAYKGLKPETVCWRREGKWIIGIEIPTECFSGDIQDVSQGANKMLCEESRDQCWRLESLTDPLEVTWGNENNRNIDQVLINAEPCGIFKLTGSDQAKGRLVKRISYGAYLLVVPSAWSFQNGMADQDIVEESISIEKCKAYYCRFEKGKDGRFTFVDENGKSWPFEAKSPLFELVGATLEDANDDMGLLFGTGPPSVRIKGHRSWKEIACVVVIQQGVEPGEDRFKDKIIPPADDTELSLGSNLQAQCSGWYSLRFYDNKQDSPIETLDFRFVSTIDKIKIHQNSVLPEESGHQEVTVELTHKPNCTIKPAAPTNNSIVIKKEMNHTIIVIPPQPEADESSWLLGIENGPHVCATLLAERIWWTFSDEATDPTDWHDKPAVLKREDFNSSAHEALWVRIPKPGWVDRVYVDFSTSYPRDFLINRDQRVKRILLDNFYDTEAISNRSVGRDLLIQVQKDSQRFSAIVGSLPAEKIQVGPPSAQPQRTADERAACRGGDVFYGNCRHCRSMLKERNYGSH
jgi:hypothetical protein